VHKNDKNKSKATPRSHSNTGRIRGCPYPLMQYSILAYVPIYTCFTKNRVNKYMRWKSEKNPRHAIWLSIQRRWEKENKGHNNPIR